MNRGETKKIKPKCNAQALASSKGGGIKMSITVSSVVVVASRVYLLSISSSRQDTSITPIPICLDGKRLTDHVAAVLAPVQARFPLLNSLFFTARSAGNVFALPALRPISTTRNLTKSRLIQ